MALFGRESAADEQRAERVRLWVQQRTGYSMASLLFGIIAVIDAWTMVIGFIAGLVAIGLGVMGLRDLRDKPHKCGRRLCKTAMALGVVGISLSLAIAAWLW